MLGYALVCSFFSLLSLSLSLARALPPIELALFHNYRRVRIFEIYVFAHHTLVHRRRRERERARGRRNETHRGERDCSTSPPACANICRKMHGDQRYIRTAHLLVSRSHEHSLTLDSLRSIQCAAHWIKGRITCSYVHGRVSTSSESSLRRACEFAYRMILILLNSLDVL